MEKHEEGFKLAKAGTNAKILKIASTKKIGVFR
jgi:hypothetical protein